MSKVSQFQRLSQMAPKGTEEEMSPEKESSNTNKESRSPDTQGANGAAVQ